MTALLGLGLFDHIQAVVDIASGPLATKAAAWSLKIFWTCVGLDFMFTLCLDVIDQDHLVAMLKLFIRRVVIIAIGLYIVTNQIQIETDMRTFTTQVITDISGSPVPLTPTVVAGMGWTLSDQIAQANTGNPILNAALAIPDAVAVATTQLAFCVVALELFVAQLMTSFLVPVASITLGLLGSRWSRHYAGVFAKVLFLTFLLQVTVAMLALLGNGIAGAMRDTITTFATAANPLTSYAGLFTDGLVYMFITLTLTSLAALLGIAVPVANAAGRAAGSFANSLAGGGASSVEQQAARQLAVEKAVESMRNSEAAAATVEAA